MLKGALAALLLVLAVAPCSGQTPYKIEDLYPGCGCSGDNSKLGELAKRTAPRIPLELACKQEERAP